MATLPQPLALQQPPVLVYPDTATARDPPAPPAGSSSHSNGSFGSVFIVLAVIIVVSAVACCLGRVCSKGKKQGKQGNKQGKQDKKMKSSNKQKPHQNSKVGQGDDDDIEFGFDKGGGGFPPMGKREGPNGPHFKQPESNNNHNAPYFPYGPPPPPPPANHHQQSGHRGGGVNGMVMNGHHQQKMMMKGHGGNPHFKGDGKYPTMEFHDGGDRPLRH